MLEKDLQKAVVDIAHLSGWKVHHTRTVQIAGGGWASPCIDKGFPDLILVNELGECLAVELKSDKGNASIDQLNWLRMLHAAGVETHIWRPADWGYIVARLGRKAQNLKRVK
jgi:hypothetical protein